MGVEGFDLGSALRLAEKVGDLEEDGGAIGGNAASVDGSEEGAGGALVICFGGSGAGEGSEFAEEIILARGARSERAVGEAESVEVEVSGLAAAASVGEGKAAAVGIGGSR
jgi:hypothetical protein